jgi:hypothetical protein
MGIQLGSLELKWARPVQVWPLARSWPGADSRASKEKPRVRGERKRKEKGTTAWTVLGRNAAEDFSFLFFYR